MKLFLKKLNISKYHEIIFYLLVFCIPFQTRTLFNPNQSYIDWFFNYHLAFFFYFTDILIIAFLVSWVTTEKIQWKKILTENWSIVLLFLTVLLSLFLPILETLFQYGAGVKHIENGLYHTIKWFELLGFTLYVSQNIQKIGQYKLILGILSISGLFQALLAIFQFSSQHSVGFKWLGEYLAPLGTSGLSNFVVNGEKIIRAYGTFPHPNILAGFLLVSLASTLYLISSLKTQKSKFFYGLVSIIIIFGLFYTFSRIAWILTILSLVYFLSFHLPRRQAGVKQFIIYRKITTEFAITGLIIIVSCGTLLATQKNLLFTRSFESDGQVSLDSRVFYNNLALESLNGKYVLGLGAGNYIPKIRDMFQVEPWQYQPPHNIFLFIFVELGALGLIAFCLMISQALSFTWNIRKQQLGYTLLLISSFLVIIGLFDHYLITIQQGRLLLFLILGLMMGTKNLKLEK